MTASAFSVTAAIPTDGFSITQGEPVIGALHGASRHYFCDYCKSWLFTRPEGIDAFVNVRSSMIDASDDLAPFVETWTREKLSWAVTSAAHSFESLPAMNQYEGLIAEYRASLGA